MSAGAGSTGKARPRERSLASLAPVALRRVERLHSEVCHSAVGLCFYNLKVLARLLPERHLRPGFADKLESALASLPAARRDVLGFLEASATRSLRVGELFAEEGARVRGALDALASAAPPPLGPDAAARESFAERVSGLIDLAMESLKAVETRLKSLRVDLSALVDGVAEESRAFCDAHGVSVERVPAQGPVPPVFARPARLRTVVAELVRNAAKYAFRDVAPARPRRVRVGVAETDARGERAVLIRIEDTGSGLPDAVRARVGSAGNSAEGRGDGLALVRRIVEREHGGALLWETGPSGTRFDVLIPVRARRLAASAAREATPATVRQQSADAASARLAAELARRGVPRTLVTRLLAEATEEIARARPRPDPGGAPDSAQPPAQAQPVPQDALLRAVARSLLRTVRVTGPLQPAGGRARVLALIGPTGVGKTTTLAKLAGRLALERGARVGLVTTDTFRVGAVEQLRVYADILRVPLAVAGSPHALEAALASLEGRDLILVDTVGSSQRDRGKLDEIHALLDARHGEVDSYLVLSPTLESRTLRSVAARFRHPSTRAIVLTKLDELERPGRLLAVLDACDLPVSYVTFGQEVPQDIAPADAADLVRRILA